MVKQYVIIAALLMVALVAGFVAAQEVTLSQETTTGAAPDTTSAQSEVIPSTDSVTVQTPAGQENPEDVETETASGLKIGWQRAKIALTFNEEKKAMEELKLAKLRLIQARIAAKNGNEKAMTGAIEAHNKIMEKIQERVSKMDGKKDEKGIKASAVKLVGLERAIEVHEQRAEILKDKISEADLTEEEKAKVEEALAKLDEKTAKLKELEIKKKEELKTKLMAVSGDTELEADKKIEDIENGQGLTVTKQIVAENKIKNTEKVIAKIEKLIAEQKAKGTDVSAIESQLATVKTTLAEAKALYAQGKYKEVIETLKPVGNFGRNLSFVMHQIKDQDKEKAKEMIEKAKERNAELKEKIQDAKEKIREQKIISTTAVTETTSQTTITETTESPTTLAETTTAN